MTFTTENWSIEQRCSLAFDILSGKTSLAQACQEHGLASDTVRAWVEQISQSARKAVQTVDLHNAEPDPSPTDYESIHHLINDKQADFIQLYTAEGRSIYDSPSVVRLYGSSYTATRQFAKKTTLIHPEDRERIRQAFNEAVQTGSESRPRPHRWLLPSGQIIWVDAIGTPILGPDGHVEHVLLAARDITKRKLAEDALTKSETLYRTLIENSADYVQLTTADGQVLYDSPSLVRLWGDRYVANHRLGEEPTLIHPEDRELVRQNWLAALRTGRISPSSHRLLLPSGEIRWVEVRGTLLLGPEGEPEKILIVMRDITERKLAEDALAKSEEQYRLLAENQTDFLHLISAEGLVLYESPSVRKLFGDAYPLNRPIGGEPSIFHPDDRERLRRSFAGLLKAGEGPPLVGRWLLPSGKVWWVEVRGKIIADDQGRPKQVLLSTRNITDRKLAEDALLEARQQADEANAAKSQFLARVSHELRTPLNAVLGYSYLLEQSPLSDEQAEQVKQINSSSRYLLGLISDVLDLSKIEAGEMLLTASDFSLHKVLRQVLDQVRVRSDAKGLQLQLQASDVPDAVHGDAQMLQQMLLNYLSNAVKFTEQGQVTLRVTAEAEQVLRFEVHDTGQGIAPERLGELFRPFQQLQVDRRGTGLGLEITRRMAELMGGQVGVSSEPGVGSCFWFSVPLQ